MADENSVGNRPFQIFAKHAKTMFP